MLPRARVELRVGNQSVMQAVPLPSLNPVLPKNSSAFTDVELKQNLEVKVRPRVDMAAAGSKGRKFQGRVPGQVGSPVVSSELAAEQQW